MRAALMQKFGFLESNTTMLTDAAATRENILSSLMKYQALAQKGDLFVFDYSGHGTLFPDVRSEDQDETGFVYLEVYNPDTKQNEVWYPRDHYDSAIVPVDARSRTSGKPWKNLILDDELAAIFAGFTAKGAQVVFISDSCHSGTIGKGKSSKEYSDAVLSSCIRCSKIRRSEDRRACNEAVVGFSSAGEPALYRVDRRERR
jgi:hypothetical protein